MLNAEAIKTQVIYQNERRPTWDDHDTPENLAQFINGEYQELLASIELDEPAFAVASEIGDVEYLCIRYEHKYGELPSDLQKIRVENLQLAEYLGLNISECVHMKVVRNDVKYPATVLSAYDYEQGMAICKKLYAEIGGDYAFSHWFLEVFGSNNAEH